MSQNVGYCGLCNQQIPNHISGCRGILRLTGFGDIRQRHGACGVRQAFQPAVATKPYTDEEEHVYCSVLFDQDTCPYESCCRLSPVYPKKRQAKLHRRRVCHGSGLAECHVVGQKAFRSFWNSISLYDECRRNVGCVVDVD